MPPLEAPRTERRKADDAPPPDVRSAPADAVRTPSGLAMKTLNKRGGGGGAPPTATDRVLLRTKTWKSDGTFVDSSGGRRDDEGAELVSVETLIPGLAEGVRSMARLESRRLWIPAPLAYGASAIAAGAPTGDLVMDVALLDIQRAAAPPPFPEDGAALPASATRSDHGFGYKLMPMSAHASEANPATNVVFNYAVWRRDGTEIASTFRNGKPEVSTLAELDPRWRTRIKMMHVGERMRFWDDVWGANEVDPNDKGTPVVGEIELLYVYDAPSRVAAHDGAGAAGSKPRSPRSGKRAEAAR
ncbi:hypothetical protein EON77_10610 [bacterium]|nr:MAG: hypothetical protein EON77_10610 [bacterium]